MPKGQLSFCTTRRKRTSDDLLKLFVALNAHSRVSHAFDFPMMARFPKHEKSSHGKRLPCVFTPRAIRIKLDAIAYEFR